MNITVTRRWFTAQSTIGELNITIVHPEASSPTMQVIQFDCFTLEPPKREDKPCCIPPGTYAVEKRFSPKHGFHVPGLKDVPGFSDIEIHPGNYPKDTEGCLLVGSSHGAQAKALQYNTEDDAVFGSKQTFARLVHEYIFPALEAGEEVWITYLEKPE